MRLKTPVVKIKNLLIGGNNPIAIQSMTNTQTADISSTVNQCIELANAGAELVRITVNDEKAAEIIPEIRHILDKKGYKDLPLIGDFHFNGNTLLKKFPMCAKSLDKYRINPGNVGNDKNFEEIIRIAKKNNKVVRIGVNVGSIKNPTIQNIVKTALNSAKFAEKLGLAQNKIVLSVKTSDVQSTIKAYELLAKKMKSHPYVIHLGLTESGSGLEGIVNSVSAIAILLEKGIGDTIRVSLTPSNSEPRTYELEVCKNILQALNLRHFKPQIISCPGCGRTNNKLLQEVTEKITTYVEKNYPNKKNLKIAVMGCIVNGPGEAKNADIALVLPGKTEKPVAQVYLKGKFNKNLIGNNISQKFTKILSGYIENL